MAESGRALCGQKVVWTATECVDESSVCRDAGGHTAASLKLHGSESTPNRVSLTTLPQVALDSVSFEEHGNRARAGDNMCIGMGKELLEHERRRNAACMEGYTGQGRQFQFENVMRHRQLCDVAAAGFRFDMAAIRHHCITKHREDELQRHLLGRCQEDVEHLVQREVLERLDRETQIQRVTGRTMGGANQRGVDKKKRIVDAKEASSI